MAWELNASDVLESWINEDAPAANNTRFLRLLAAAKREFKRVLKQNDDWFTSEIAQNPDFQDELNDIASAAIQRTWEADPSGATANSWGELGFSRSTSRDNGGPLLVTFYDDEIARIIDMTSAQKLGRIKIISQVASPNFPVSRLSGWNFNDAIYDAHDSWKGDVW